MIVVYVTDYKTSQVARSSTIVARVWDILETMTSEVMNDEGGELWTCSLAFEIPIRYNNEVRQDIVQTRRRSPT
jgi:hypothetical protein